LANQLGSSVLTQGSLRQPQRQFDLLLQLDGDRVVVELEIGEGWRKILDGIVQADEYRERLNAVGILTGIYPPFHPPNGGKPRATTPIGHDDPDASPRPHPFPQGAFFVHPIA
jgi:hypothetical protein